VCKRLNFQIIVNAFHLLLEIETKVFVFNEEHFLSREDAYQQGLKLLLLLRRTYKPMAEEQFESIQLRRAETFSEWARKIMEDEENYH
jgi:hypothetical protein